jgi:hypothetical protein
MRRNGFHSLLVISFIPINDGEPINQTKQPCSAHLVGKQKAHMPNTSSGSVLKDRSLLNGPSKVPTREVRMFPPCFYASVLHSLRLTKTSVRLKR